MKNQQQDDQNTLIDELAPSLHKEGKKNTTSTMLGVVRF